MTRNEKLLAIAKKYLYKIARLECSLEDAPSMAQRALFRMAKVKSIAKLGGAK